MTCSLVVGARWRQHSQQATRFAHPISDSELGGLIYQELVSRIENGAANPELDTLGKIAAAPGVHPRALLDE